MATKKRSTSRSATKKMPATIRTQKSSTSTMDERMAAGTERTDQKSKKYIIIAAVVLLIGALLYYFRSLFVVAIVNGRPVTRVEYMKELENQAGQQALDTLVTKTLIFQKASKDNVSVTEDEVNKELQTIEASMKERGQSLDQILVLQGLTRDGLKDQIRIQKLVQKMSAKNVKVSEKEIDDYIKQNEATLSESTDTAKLRSDVSEQLKQQKTNDSIQTWIQDLRQKAQINYLVDYKPQQKPPQQ